MPAQRVAVAARLALGVDVVMMVEGHPPGGLGMSRPRQALDRGDHQGDRFRRLVLCGTAAPGKDDQFHLCLAIAVECLRLRPALGVRILLETPAGVGLEQLIADADWLRTVLLGDGPVLPADLPALVACRPRVDQTSIGTDCDLLVLSQALPEWGAGDRRRRPTLRAFDSPWAREHRLTGISENLPYLASLLLRACNDAADLPLTITQSGSLEKTIGTSGASVPPPVVSRPAAAISCTWP